VKLVTMPFTSMGAALQSKAIDGGLLTEPQATLYTEQGFGFPFERAADVITNPWLEVGIIVANSDWMKAKPAQARASAVASLKGPHDYYEAVQGNGSNRDEVISILMKYTPLKDRSLYDH